MPQEPQLLGSFWKLKHNPLQKVCPDGQFCMHRPVAELQNEPLQQPPLGEPALQAWPDWTQEGIGVVQTPLLQSWPEAHSTPHEPQLLGSLTKFTQYPLHKICPDAQLGAHWPEAALQERPEQQPPLGEAALHCWPFWMQGGAQVPDAALHRPEQQLPLTKPAMQAWPVWTQEGVGGVH